MLCSVVEVTNTEKVLLWNRWSQQMFFPDIATSCVEHKKVFKHTFSMFQLPWTQLQIQHKIFIFARSSLFLPFGIFRRKLRQMLHAYNIILLMPLSLNRNTDSSWFSCLFTYIIYNLSVKVHERHATVSCFRLPSLIFLVNLWTSSR